MSRKNFGHVAILSFLHCGHMAILSLRLLISIDPSSTAILAIVQFGLHQ